MKKPKKLGFEPVPLKNVLLASVVHGISCLLKVFIILSMRYTKLAQMRVVAKISAF
jgi:hypothetical protein